MKNLILIGMIAVSSTASALPSPSDRAVSQTQSLASGMFQTGEIGDFSYSRKGARSTMCVYTYEDSRRQSLLRVGEEENCPDIVTDRDLYPELYKIRYGS